MNQLSQFINNHWSLCLTFVALLICVIINELLSQKKKAKEISPQKTIDLINNDLAVIIDLRDKETFKKGHIINAINMTADDINDSKLSQYKNKSLVLVCNRGQSAPAVASKIKTLGLNPLVLSGGMMAWHNASLPVVKK
ncbi:MAG: sulfurtransferase [Legionella sp.]|nr:MAG: sulfurtransferase [Legionella sp.]PJD98476.1 MAG: sulfurtransferase [Legionella sp.]